MCLRTRFISAFTWNVCERWVADGSGHKCVDRRAPYALNRMLSPLNTSIPLGSGATMGSVLSVLSPAPSLRSLVQGYWFVRDLAGAYRGGPIRTSARAA